MTLTYLLVLLFGLTLLAVGLYYQLNKVKLKSDPILITACYVWGGFNIAACML